MKMKRLFFGFPSQLLEKERKEKKGGMLLLLLLSCLLLATCQEESVDTDTVGTHVGLLIYESLRFTTQNPITEDIWAQVLKEQPEQKIWCTLKGIICDPPPLCRAGP